MALDTTRAHPAISPELHDDLREMKQQMFKRYLSPWMRLDASATVSVTHGLGDIPHMIDIIEATDAQGTSPSTAASVTTTKTVTVVTVTNGLATARFIRVRAF